jgi:5-formyltetrahydrofolate cyclo-ligase
MIMAPTRWRAASRLRGQRDYAGSVQTQPEAVDLAAMAAIDAAAIAGAKRTLRKAILFRRDSRSNEQRAHDDASRMEMVESSLEDRIPDTVAAYLSTGSEPGTLQLVAWLAANRVRVLLPVLSHPIGGRLDKPAWAPYEGPDALRVGASSILEPTGEVVPSEQLPEAELIICPGLAANLHGDRLGRGGGWYDRALRHASQSAPVWLLLNDDEVLETIPVHAWDHRVDVIITPTRMITCEPSVLCNL